MAKYDLTYACGHERTIQLWGPTRDRERKLAWLATQDCRICARAAREAAGPTAHIVFSAGLPPHVPEGIIVALVDAYLVRERLKAEGYHYEAECHGLTGFLDLLYGGPPAWCRRFPATEAGVTEALAEIDRLVTSGIVPPDRAKRQDPIALRAELAFRAAARRTAAKEAADEAAAEAARQSEQPVPRKPAEATPRRRITAPEFAAMLGAERIPPAPGPALSIEVTPFEDGAAVRFPHDGPRIERFKARFPQARWGDATRSWHVPGKLAGRRAARWVEEEMTAAEAERRAVETARTDAEFDGRALPPEGEAYFDALRRAGGRMSSDLVQVRPRGDAIEVRCRYDERAVGLAKRANGRWDRDRKCWVYPMAAARQLHSVVDAIDATLEGDER